MNQSIGSEQLQVAEKGPTLSPWDPIVSTPYQQWNNIGTSYICMANYHELQTYKLKSEDVRKRIPFVINIILKSKAKCKLQITFSQDHQIAFIMFLERRTMNLQILLSF